jgi:EAL domain-containing protein (putative c-di-GMP-specific phosphodiesterase class I)
MLDVEKAILTLKALRELGVFLAIDDFGTGYASLSYLTRFPVHAIKIDQVFVQAMPTDTSSAAVVDAIVALGKALDLRIVAEGVETEEQLGFLRKRSCHEAQGFYFSKAMPAGQFEQLLRTPISYYTSTPRCSRNE